MNTIALVIGAVMAWGTLWCHGQDAPGVGKQVEKTPRFDPYIPEELVETDNKGVKWYRFSDRQKRILKARKLDRQAFSEYIAKSWPIERLENFAAETKPWPRATKMGFTGEEFIKLDPYAGLNHRFDRLSVTVTDMGLDFVFDGKYAESERRSVWRYGWLIHFSKGRKDWGIQERIPISSFGR